MRGTLPVWKITASRSVSISKSLCNATTASMGFFQFALSATRVKASSRSAIVTSRLQILRTTCLRISASSAARLSMAVVVVIVVCSGSGVGVAPGSPALTVFRVFEQVQARATHGRLISVAPARLDVAETFRADIRRLLVGAGNKLMAVAHRLVAGETFGRRHWRASFLMGPIWHRGRDSTIRLWYNSYP